MATLASRIGNQAALRATLRRGVGLPNDSVLVPDATADDALREGLSALNLKKPRIGTGTFTTVADQQAYSPLPADALGFRRVFWPHSSGRCAQQSALFGALSPFFGAADEFGTAVSLEPGAILALQRSGGWLRRLGSTSGVRIEGATVYLMPTPEEAGTSVLFTYAALRYASVAVVEEVDARAFWAAAEAWLHRALAAGAGGVRSVRDLSEGTAIEMSPEHHLKLAEQRQRSFNRMFPPPAGWP